MNFETLNNTTIRASMTAWKLVNDQKRIGESMSDVIERVFTEYNTQENIK